MPLTPLTAMTLILQTPYQHTIAQHLRELNHQYLTIAQPCSNGEICQQVCGVDYPFDLGAMKPNSIALVAPLYQVSMSVDLRVAVYSISHNLANELRSMSMLDEALRHASEPEQYFFVMLDQDLEIISHFYDGKFSLHRLKIASLIFAHNDNRKGEGSGSQI